MICAGDVAHFLRIVRALGLVELAEERRRALGLLRLVVAPALEAGDREQARDDGEHHELAVVVPPRLDRVYLFLFFQDRKPCHRLKSLLLRQSVRRARALDRLARASTLGLLAPRLAQRLQRERLRVRFVVADRSPRSARRSRRLSSSAT